MSAAGVSPENRSAFLTWVRSQSIAGVDRQAHGVFNLQSGSREKEHIRSFVKVKEIFRENLTFELGGKRYAGDSRQARYSRCLLLLSAQVPSSLL